MENCTLSYNTGDIIGDYKLLARCGEGAYGTVFLAENQISGHQVALKIIYRHGNSFERELKGLRQYQQICRRTNLLQIYHVGEEADLFYYTMDAADPLGDGEYIPKTLANVLKIKGRLSPEEIRKMAEELFILLTELHRHGILHRDIKPDNILWIDGQAVPGDIGLATADPQTMLAGTPGFVPPEVLAGIRPPEEKDDFYALGKVLYCALTRKPASAFPEFPESRTLTGSAGIIKLYNKLCGGEKLESISPKSKKRKYFIPAFSAVCIAAAGAAAGFFLHPEPLPVPPEKIIVEVPAPAPPVDPDAEKKKFRESWEKQWETRMREARKMPPVSLLNLDQGSRERSYSERVREAEDKVRQKVENLQRIKDKEAEIYGFY